MSLWRILQRRIARGCSSSAPRSAEDDATSSKHWLQRAAQTVAASAAQPEHQLGQSAATVPVDHRGPAGNTAEELKLVRPSAVCACTSVQPAKPTVPPTPGSVAPYAHHVLLRLAPPAGSEGLTGDAWWPPILERHPAMLQAFAAVAAGKRRIDGVVKVTAYDDVHAAAEAAQEPGTVDMMVFPAGACLSRLPVEDIRRAVSHHIADESSGQEAAPLDLPPQAEQRPFSGMGLFVCAHGSRDSRCGLLGRALALRLRQLVAARGLPNISVWQVSHVGGHKYAGNVLVYGGISPCDGDWFGGVTPEAAEPFLDALLQVQVGEDGGAGSPQLRRWWRGRMGLSAEEQAELFAAGASIPAGEGWDSGYDSSAETSEDEYGLAESSSSASSSDNGEARLG